MKRTLIITLLLLVAAFSFGQTNSTFNNLDVRNTTKLRGLIYPFGAVATSPINTAVHEIAMINNTTFALCRMDFKEFADSIANYLNPIIGTHWYTVPPDTIKTIYNVVVDSSLTFNENLYMPTTTATTGQIKQNGNTVFHTYCTVANQANLFIGQTSGNYAATSSMNIAIGPGLMTMLSSGFGNSVINGGDLISSGHYNNYFGYGSGVSTSTGSANIGIGAYAMPFNSTGSYNTCIGWRAGYNETGSYKYYMSMDSTSWANGMASGSKLLIYADQSNAAKSNHFLNIFAKVSIGASKNPNEMLSVTGNASITGYLKSGTGSIADNDSTPSVASYNTFIYAGSANPVSIDALDDHVVGCYYTIIGNSNTYTITVIDGTPAGGDSFNLAGGNWVGGSQDVLLLYCIAADAFIEVSRSDN